jgi:glycosyltransferase involved in cell wall biosynthesis
MKIMLVIPHLSGGGGERVLSDLASGLESDDVVVVVFERKAGYPVNRRVVSFDLPIRRGALLGRAMGFLRRSLQFRRVVRREQPDVVVSFMGEANLLNAMFSPRPVITVHNHLSSLNQLERTAASGGVRRLRKWAESTASETLMKMLYRRAMVVAVGEAIKSELIEYFGVPRNRVVVIPNAVNTAEVRERAAEPVEVPWNSAWPALITAGRLTLQKGQWHLLRAFAEVRKQMVCQLAILGTGELEAYLKGLAKDLGIERDVYFLGWQSNPFKFMAQANLFVLPSITEGFPLVLLEAMTCGLPVVSTDCPGDSRAILAPGTPAPGASLSQAEFARYGVLVPPFDLKRRAAEVPATAAERALAAGIVGLMENREALRRYAAGSSERIADFTRRDFIEKYRKVIVSCGPKNT